MQFSSCIISDYDNESVELLSSDYTIGPSPVIIDNECNDEPFRTSNKKHFNQNARDIGLVHLSKKYGNKILK